MQLMTVAYGRTPYVKYQKQLLTYKYDASVSNICPMAELMQIFLRKGLINSEIAYIIRDSTVDSGDIM